MDHPPLRHAALAMGTRFEMVLHHEDERLARAAAEEAFSEVLRLHSLWSPFERASMIASVNSSLGCEVRVDRDTLDLLLVARRLWHETQGRFDPTIGTLMRGWGFRGGVSERSEPRPTAGMQHVEIDERAGTVRLARADLQLDMGSIGKGAALDSAGRILREAGIESALLHAGTSSVLAIGGPPGTEEGWRVRVGMGAAAPAVVLRDESLSVSEPSGREIDDGEGAIGHVLDPRTGEPATGSKLAAVICPDATTADAWSTACLVEGKTPPTAGVKWAYVVPAEL